MIIQKLRTSDDAIGELANDLATYEAAIEEIQKVSNLSILCIMHIHSVQLFKT